MPYVDDGEDMEPLDVDDGVDDELYVDDGDDVLAPTDVLLLIAVAGVLAPADACVSAPVAEDVAEDVPALRVRQSLSAEPCRFAHGAYDMREGVSGVVVALGVVSFACTPAAPAVNAIARSTTRGLKMDWFMRDLLAVIEKPLLRIRRKGNRARTVSTLCKALPSARNRRRRDLLVRPILRAQGQGFAVPNRRARAGPARAHRT